MKGDLMDKKKHTFPTFIGGSVVMLVVCVVVVSLANSVLDVAVNRPTATRTSRFTPAPPTQTPIPPTPTLAPLAPAYAEIAGNLETMTEAQWKAYLPTLKGNMVTDWRGWVADVDLGGNGVYTL